MLQRIAVGLGRHLGELRSLVVPAAEASQAHVAKQFASSAASSAELKMDNFDLRDPDTSFARMLLAQAEAEKKKDLMTKDIMKLIEWLEDATPADDKDFPGKLKDVLPTFDKQTQNEICKDIPTIPEMAGMQPPLKDMIEELSSFGEAGRIVDIAYKYVYLLDPKLAAAKSLAVELVLPKQGTPAELAEYKAMLLSDMSKKGRYDGKMPVTWTVTVDPSIRGGCIYRMGDVELDCSKKSLEDEFYAALEQEGIKRIA